MVTMQYDKKEAKRDCGDASSYPTWVKMVADQCNEADDYAL